MKLKIEKQKGKIDIERKKEIGPVANISKRSRR